MARRLSPAARSSRGGAIASSSERDAGRAAFNDRVLGLLSAGEHKLAATETIRALGPELLRHLQTLLGHTDDAKEAFAQTCERLWTGLPEFRGEASLRTWAFRLAWSAAADLRKDAFRARGRRLQSEEAAQLVRPGAGRTESHVRFERLRLSLETLRAALTLEEQCLLQLRIDQELSWEECASVLSAGGEPVKRDALMKRFERIKARLGALAAQGEEE
jgi:RNA polymerase sigma-70 factor (ECF subfamily)